MDIAKLFQSEWEVALTEPKKSLADIHIIPKPNTFGQLRIESILECNVYVWCDVSVFLRFGVKISIVSTVHT